MGEVRRRTTALTRFSGRLQDEINSKAWPKIAAKASQETYRQQVLEGAPDDAASAVEEAVINRGMSEAPFVA